MLQVTGSTENVCDSCVFMEKFCRKICWKLMWNNAIRVWQHTAHMWFFKAKLYLEYFFTLLFFGSCPANFTGARCETDVDECLVLSNLCKNGATCTNFVGGYTCRCINGWEGVDCATNTDDCLTQDGSSKCLHSGICIDRVGKFDCFCTPNYTGKLYSHLPRSSMSHQINHTPARITWFV